jgi:hypothetical protein
MPAGLCGLHLLFNQLEETEGLPIDIRWAKALEKRLDESLYLRDGELLAGSLTKLLEETARFAHEAPTRYFRWWNPADSTARPATYPPLR